MRRIILTTLMLISLSIPFVADAALLPQPTGSCPVKCPDAERTYAKDPVLGSATGVPTGCKDGKEVSMVCKLGKCVFSGNEPQEWDIPCNYSLADIVQSAVNFVTLFLSIAGSLALLMFAYGGYGMLTSVGNPEAIGIAKKRLTGGFIGLIIVLGAVVFVQFGAALLGANVLSTGEVQVGATLCAGQEGEGSAKEAIECGFKMVCYKNRCITQCDWHAQTEEEYYGYACQPAVNVTQKYFWKCCKKDTTQSPPVDQCETANSEEGKTGLNQKGYNCVFDAPPGKMYCENNLCPGEAGYKCCISAERKKMIENK